MHLIQKWQKNRQRLVPRQNNSAFEKIRTHRHDSYDLVRTFEFRNTWKLPATRAQDRDKCEIRQLHTYEQLSDRRTDSYKEEPNQTATQSTDCVDIANIQCKTHTHARLTTGLCVHAYNVAYNYIVCELHGSYRQLDAPTQMCECVRCRCIQLAGRTAFFVRHSCRQVFCERPLEQILESIFFPFHQHYFPENG